MERERGEGFCSCDRGGFAARSMRRAVALVVAGGGVGVAVAACRVIGGAARGERGWSFAGGFAPGSAREPTCPANAKTTGTSAPAVAAVVKRLNRLEFDVMLVLRLRSRRSPSPGSPLRREASEDRTGKLERCLRSTIRGRGVQRRQEVGQRLRRSRCKLVPGLQLFFGLIAHELRSGQLRPDPRDVASEEQLEGPIGDDAHLACRLRYLEQMHRSGHPPSEGAAEFDGTTAAIPLNRPIVATCPRDR